MHHPSAIIDPSAKIDESVEIGPFSLIGPDVTIGKDTKIESHVILKGPTKIGERNHIFQFSTVGDGSPDKKYKNGLTSIPIDWYPSIEDAKTEVPLPEKGSIM